MTVAPRSWYRPAVANTVSVGQVLGPYVIDAPIGEGGMGEVYRARDTKLNRDVALKKCCPPRSRGSDRLARFQREAHVLAALNHPNIAAIYGFEESDGVQALVLELVDGPTLADRLARIPAPRRSDREANRRSARSGPRARDRPSRSEAGQREADQDGSVKVLDFGLAKATEAAGGAQFDLTKSPTRTSPAMTTGVGLILGTAAYMAPGASAGGGGRPADGHLGFRSSCSRC